MKINIKKAIGIALTFSIATFAQQKGTFTDARDNKTYKTVKIGKQTWMAENLNYHGSDGYLGLCYDKEPENCQEYGRLYDWSEAMGIDRAFNNKSYAGKNAKHKGVCPAGWHLPNDKEWDALIVFAGGKDIAGKKLKAKEGWEAYDFSGRNPNAPKCKWTEEYEDDRGRKSKIEHECSTDEFGFSALPGGYYNSEDGYFRKVGNDGLWWSASESHSRLAYYRGMYYDGEGVYWRGDGKIIMFSVRCLQD